MKIYTLQKYRIPHEVISWVIERPSFLSDPLPSAIWVILVHSSPVSNVVFHGARRNWLSGASTRSPPSQNTPTTATHTQFKGTNYHQLMLIYLINRDDEMRQENLDTTFNSGTRHTDLGIFPSMKRCGKIGDSSLSHDLSSGFKFYQLNGKEGWQFVKNTYQFAHTRCHASSWWWPQEKCPGPHKTVRGCSNCFCNCFCNWCTWYPCFVKFRFSQSKCWKLHSPYMHTAHHLLLCGLPSYISRYIMERSDACCAAHQSQFIAEKKCRWT